MHFSNHQQFQSPPDAMVSSARGMARLNGSNRAAWNAMDLEISAHVPPNGNAGTDNGALSARNVLLRQKLRERKRYDSADDAMKKAAAAASRAASREYSISQGTPSYAVPKEIEFGTPMATAASSSRQAQHATDMEVAKRRVGGPHEAVSSPCATAATGRIQFASMSPSRTGKYGALESTAGPSVDKKMPVAGGTKYGKLSAAHVLIRRKLKERKRFDSADYAMEKQGRPTDFVSSDIAAGTGTSPVQYGAMGASSQAGIDHQVKHIKLSEAPDGRVASPVVANAAQAALAARAARYAGLAGARREGAVGTNTTTQAACDRYGLDKSMISAGAAAARNIVLQRKLAERKMFDSADHFKEAA